VKEEGLKPGESVEEVSGEEKPKKVKTRSENTVSTAEWSQEQQRALEAALTKYPKGVSVDRWEKIANCVEGKTKVRLFICYYLFFLINYIEICKFNLFIYHYNFKIILFVYRKNVKCDINNWWN